MTTIETATMSEEANPVYDNGTNNDEYDDTDDTIQELRDTIDFIQQQLALQPYNYDLHVQLIDTLHTLYSIDSTVFHQLQQARVNMHNVYPLTLSMAQQWIENLQQHNATEQLLKVYDDVLSDYCIPSIYINKCRSSELKWFNEIKSIADDNVIYITYAYSTAIDNLQYHTDDSIAQVYDMCRAFYNRLIEYAMTTTMTEKQQLVYLQKQQAHISKLYIQQLSQPHQSIDTTYQQYIEWCQQSEYAVDRSADTLYQSSKQRMHDRMPYEQQLQQHNTTVDGQPTADLLSAYWSYIQYEIQQSQSNQHDKHPYQRVVALYERCIVQCYAIPDVWLQYIAYVKKYTQSADSLVVIRLYRRAIRNNCPYAPLYEGYIRYIDVQIESVRLVRQLHVIDENDYASMLPLLYHKFNELSLPVSDSVISVHIAMLMHTKLINDQSYNTLWQNIVQLLRAATDQSIPINSELYYIVFKDMRPNDKQLQQNAMQQLYELKHTEARAYIEYAEYCITSMSTDNALATIRDLYRSALDKHIPLADHWNTESLCYAWLRFERIHGTIESYDNANTIVEPKLQQIAAARYAKQQQRAAQNTKQVTTTPTSTKANKTATSNNHTTNGKSNKHKAHKNNSNKQITNTTPVNNTANETKSADTATTSAIKRRRVESERTEQPPINKAVQSTPQTNAIQHQSTADSTMTDSTNTISTNTSVYSKSIADEPHTIFILNIPYNSANVDTIRKLFESYGTIIDMVVRDKGFGWIQYSNDTEMNTAINTMNGYMLNNRALKVTISNKREAEHSKQIKTQHELSHTIYVKHIPTQHSNLEQFVRDKFSQCGSITALRLNKDPKTNKYKNFAFIEYDSSDSVQKAVLMYNDTHLLDDSNPINDATTQKPKNKLVVTPAEDKSKQKSSIQSTDNNKQPQRSSILNVRSSAVLMAPRSTVAAPKTKLQVK